MTIKTRPNIRDLLQTSRALAEKTALTELSSGSALHDAIRYHYQTSGSEARATLCLSASIALGLIPDAAIRLAASVETLHNASLIQDDLQDGDEIRRGKTAIWKKFSPDIAINATDLLIASAFELVASAGSDSVHRLVTTMNRAIARTLQGQTKDLNAVRDLGVDQAIAVAKEKSGPLFSLSLELPLVLAGHSSFLRTAREAGAAFGIGYQIFDDINDAARDRESGNLSNLALLLGSSGDSTLSSLEGAEGLAHHYLQEAASGATALPNGCGALLADKCAELLSELDREAA
ncbi:MAG: polyprenyl synthetase family protein [Pseudomonadota bacterium]|nr:polyprenyl synthetase family protein [Pseudomonadota bacterium]